MRKSVTLEADAEAVRRQSLCKLRLSFKRALDQSVRAGLVRPAAGNEQPLRQHSVQMGLPDAGLTRALVLADELEDQHNPRQYHRS